jgi:hypothetical protein
MIVFESSSATRMGRKGLRISRLSSSALGMKSAARLTASTYPTLGCSWNRTFILVKFFYSRPPSISGKEVGSVYSRTNLFLHSTALASAGMVLLSWRNEVSVGASWTGGIGGFRLRYTSTQTSTTSSGSRMRSSRIMSRSSPGKRTFFRGAGGARTAAGAGVEVAVDAVEVPLLLAAGFPARFVDAKAGMRPGGPCLDASMEKRSQLPNFN